MFQKARRKLSVICCFTMAWIVLIIVLCCLHVSEKNMYGQVKALFFLQANTISSDLYASKNISIEWYMRSTGNAQNALSIETGGVPSTLTSVALPQEKQALIQDVKKAIHLAANQGEVSSPIKNIPGTGTVSSKMEQDFFEYTSGKERFLVMDARFFEKEREVDVLYLYSLGSFLQDVRTQRLWFGFIWLASILGLYLFSYLFTSHVLQPLIQNDERQKQFIAFASHELRSPLAVFRTGLSLLKNNPGTEKSQRIFSLLGNEMSRMERFVQDLLCLASMELAGLQFQAQEASLAELLQSIYERYAPLAAQRQLSLTLSIEGQEGYPCLCDPQRIEQAVVILLDNALSYTPAGQQVTLRLFRLRAKCCIQVIDTGIGIPDAEKGKIFGRFYRADPSRSQKGHFGLGLSIAKEICRAHGGRISVCDTDGGGSTFTFPIHHAPGP